MSLPTYQQFVQVEAPQVRDAYVAAHGVQPSASDMYHFAWRRLVEGWSQPAILWDIAHPGVPLPVPPLPAAPVVRPAGKIFKTETGLAWRYRGVSAFKLLHRYAQNEDITPFLNAYAGFNVLRVWPYVQGPAWLGQDWPTPPPVDVIKAFLRFVGQRGWNVELTLLTDASQARMAWAKALVPQLAAAPRPSNLLLEAANEPETNKQIPTSELRTVLDASGFAYASGNYEDSTKAFGPYLVTHTSRDNEWPRRAHDAIEWWNGGGPNSPSDPAHKCPCVLDEPAKYQDVGASPDDWRAYFGGAAIMGAGGTFHSETGKFGLPPTATEQPLVAAALEGLTAFPPEAPLGLYSRPVEATLRTYVVGNYMVRVRPTTSSPPEAGWIRTGSSNILWRK